MTDPFLNTQSVLRNDQNTMGESNLRATRFAQYKKEDEMKLIERSINRSFLATINPKQKIEFKEENA